MDLLDDSLQHEIEPLRWVTADFTGVLWCILLSRLDLSNPAIDVAANSLYCCGIGDYDRGAMLQDRFGLIPFLLLCQKLFGSSGFGMRPVM